jgi:Phosphotransferase enzyme family
VKALAGDAAVDASLERVLRHLGVERSKVLSADRTPSRFATLFPADVVTVRLHSGETRSVFVKRLGSEEADHPDKERRDREACVYEQLLDDERLPVPRFYGWEWDADGRRRELYLEYIDDLSLRYQPLDHWLAAARELARLHRWFAERRDRVRPLSFLIRIDEEYVRAWAGRAVDTTSSLSPQLGIRLRHAVEGIAPAGALLARMPPTLVHNDLSPKNAIAVTGSEIQRIAFVDWELAGIGCGILDVVHLAYGLDHDACQRLFDAYWGALEGSSLAVEDRKQRATLIAASELHKTLYRLAHVTTLGSDEDTVRRWLKDAASWRSRL